MVAQAIERPRRTLNEADKGVLVQCLWEAVDHGAGSLANVPGLVRRVIETGAWKHRVHRGKVYEHARFIDFITTKPMAGCGWPPEKVEALIKDEPEVLTMWRKAVVAPEGARTDLQPHNNVSQLPPVQGNSRAYTLARLEREAPVLHRRVCTGELSANAAAIEAGFRKKPTPFEQIQKLIPKLSEKERLALLEMLRP